MAQKENQEMALDLLIARAALDEDLRQELLANPQAQCLENGIQLDEGTQLVFKNPESTVIIKEIPVLQSDSKTVLATENTTRELISNGFNTSSESTETEVEAVQTAVEVSTAVEAVEVAEAAVVVVVLT